MYNFNLINADTDSVMVAKPDGSPFSKEEQVSLLKELNDLFPEHINWDDDGYFETVAVLKAKNYILKTHTGKITLKGSSIKTQQKEPALKEMMLRMIDSLMSTTNETLIDIYNYYIREAMDVQDISRWCAKKTITKPVLECATNVDARLNERKVYDAVKNIPGLQEGDKVYLYPCIISQHEEHKEFKNGNVKTKVIKEVGLKLLEQWDGDHDSEKLIDRVVATTNIFNNLLGDDTFVDYTKSKNKAKLDALISPTEWC